MGTPARLQVVRVLVDHGLPITRACEAAGISRSSFHYESRRSDDVELVERIIVPARSLTAPAVKGVLARLFMNRPGFNGDSVV